MKKLVILIIVMMFAIAPPAVMAHENGEAKAGSLFLFQKCDASLIGTSGYDSLGCPNIGTGPWPIFSDNNRWGKLNYSLWGDKFKFSFSGRGLPPGTNYTLIYYPDPWPGNGLICLGSGQSTPSMWKVKGNWGNGKWGHKGGNIAIHGDVNIGTSLPANYDANFNPILPSGAVGAKIWLVLSDDVQCTNGDQGPHMLNWNPSAYLFEFNLIIFEQRPKVPDDDDDDHDGHDGHNGHDGDD